MGWFSKKGETRYAYFILLFLSCLGVSCKPIVSGIPFGFNQSSKESKLNNVFIDSYEIIGNEIIDPITHKKIKIKEIFLEYEFMYDVDNKFKINPLSSTRMHISLKSKTPDDYSITWLIGDYDSIYFGGGSDYFDARCGEFGKLDTLEVCIRNGDYAKDTIYSKIQIIKKKK